MIWDVLTVVLCVLLAAAVFVVTGFVCGSEAEDDARMVAYFESQGIDMSYREW